MTTRATGTTRHPNSRTGSEAGLEAPEFDVERISKLILDDLIPSLEHLRPRGIAMGVGAPPMPELDDGVPQPDDDPPRFELN
jgi:hypothetical protein